MFRIALYNFKSFAFVISLPYISCPLCGSVISSLSVIDSLSIIAVISITIVVHAFDNRFRLVLYKPCKANLGIRVFFQEF